MKHICARLLLVLLLLPAIAVRNDEIKLSDLSLCNAHDHTMSGLNSLSKDHGKRATLTDRPNYLKVAAMAILHTDSSFSILSVMAHDMPQERPGTIRVGRAPPSASL